MKGIYVIDGGENIEVYTEGVYKQGTGLYLVKVVGKETWSALVAVDVTEKGEENVLGYSYISSTYLPKMEEMFKTIMNLGYPQDQVNDAASLGTQPAEEFDLLFAADDIPKFSFNHLIRVLEASNGRGSK